MLVFGGGLLPSLLCAVTFAQEAPASDLAEEAGLHFTIAVERYQAGDYPGALEHLLASNRLAPNKNVQFNIARTYEKLDQLNQAYRHYSDYLAVETDPVQRAVAAEALQRLSSRLALVQVTSDPAGATVYVDRKELGIRGRTPVTLALPPGEHHILLERPGYYAREVVVDAQLGKTASLSSTILPVQGTVELVGGPAAARVHLDRADGPVIGAIPGVFRLPPGPTRLFIEADGHQPREVVVDIEAERSTRAEINLPLWTGSVLVDADIAGALIEVDGEGKGFTPTVLELPTGTHRLRVTLPGHRPFEQELQVSRDRQTRLDVSLSTLVEVAAASRSVEDAALAPASVSVIPAEELRAFGYASVYEALLGTRGVYGSTDLTYEYLGVRGFARPGDYGNRILVTMDGHALNDEQIGASYVSHDLLSSLDDIEAIEVVRGPGSALYGSNAVFGVVNLVTRDAETALPAHVALRADDERSLRARAGVSGGNEGRGYWLSAAGTLSQGDDYYFPEYATPDDAQSGWSRGADGSQAATILGKGWVGDLQLSIYQNLRHQQIPTGAFETNLADPRTANDDLRGAFELRYEPHLGAKAQLFARAWLDTNNFDGHYPYGRKTVYHDTWDCRSIGIEPRLVLQPSSHVELTLGGEGRTAVGDRLLSSVNGETFLDEDPEQKSFAAYAVAALSGKFARLTLGGRFDYFTMSEVGAFSPRAALLFTPGERDVLKLLYGTAFRAPSPYEFFYNDDGATQVAPESLDPETVRTMELAEEHQFDHGWALSSALYNSVIRDLVDTVETGEMGTEGALFQYTNRDDLVYATGLEAELRREWREGTLFSVQSSIQNTTAASDRLTGAPLTNSPAYLGGLKAAHPFAIPNSTLATRLRVESPRMTTQDTETDWALLWDLMLTGALPNAEASYLLGVTNLLDWQASSPGGYDLRQDAVPLPGRALRVGLRAGF